MPGSSRQSAADRTVAANARSSPRVTRGRGVVRLLKYRFRAGLTGAAPLRPLAPPASVAGPPPDDPGADAAPPPAYPRPAPPATGRRTPEMALQEGNAALARRDYAAAEASAREVLQGNRASPRATD